MGKTRYFSEIHTSRASQLEGQPVTVADSEETTRLRRALLDYPDDYALLLGLAQELGQQLRYQEAIEALTIAIQQQPDNSLAYRRRAPRYYSTLRPDLAYADYGVYNKAHPGRVEAVYRQGITAYAAGWYDRAKELMAHCIRIYQEAADDEMLVAAIFWYQAAWLCHHANDEASLAITAYREGMETGHHFAFHTAAKLLLGRCTVAEAEAVVTPEVDDLDYSMIAYGLYLYHRWVQPHGAKADAVMAELLRRDYYWAGFAWIAAYLDANPQLRPTAAPPESDSDPTVPIPLRDYLTGAGELAIAFSGGVDSAYLLYAAARHCRRVRAYYVHSQFQPAFELADARRLAAQLGVEMTVLPLDALQSPVVAANPPDRCYHCKKSIFGAILTAAAADGFVLLADGTNASDDEGDRPGIRALRELSVVSPLRLCGLPKSQIRQLSRAAGLFTWNKPAYACLATRIPTGRTLTATDLARVEQGEQLLMELGFGDLRLRLTPAGVKLQLPENQLDKAVAMRHTIVKGLEPWFGEITLDLTPR